MTPSRLLIGLAAGVATASALISAPAQAAPATVTDTITTVDVEASTGLTTTTTTSTLTDRRGDLVSDTQTVDQEGGPSTGRVFTVERDSRGLPITSTLVATSEESVRTTVQQNTYSPSGRLLERVESVVDDYGWQQLESRTVLTFVYDTDGNLVEVATATDDDGDGVVDETSVERVTLGMRGLVVAQSGDLDLDADGDVDESERTEVTFDRRGREVRYVSTTSTPDAVLTSVERDTTYDSRGRRAQVSSLLSGEDGAQFLTTEAYTYDERGRVLTSTISNDEAGIDGELDGVVDSVSTTTDTWDVQGRLLSSRTVSTRAGEVTDTSSITTTYGRNGPVLTVLEFGSPDTPSGLTTIGYQYDASGRETERVVEFRYPSLLEYRSVTTTTYPGRSTRVEVTTLDENGDGVVDRTTTRTVSTTG